MANLYADEQFPRPVVEFLRNFGHNVLTTQEAGQANFIFVFTNQILILYFI
jgi:hypothetical protein